MAQKAICKLRCSNTEPAYEGAEAESVSLYAEYDETLPEDQKFSQYTPSAELRMTVDNPALKGFFEPNKSYYVTIEPVE